MCGIVGLLSKTKNGFFSIDVDTFQDLLVIDSLRGSDGTGLFGVYDTGNSFINKVGAHPYALLTNPIWAKIRDKIARNCHAVIGHNRKATMGKISNETSHPFRENHIILVHNGQITNYKDFANTEVDSHALTHLLASSSPEDAILKIQGAFALVWYDLKTKKVHFIRNDERPLCLLETKNHWIISSEMGAVQWIIARSVHLELISKQLLNPLELYTWDLDTFQLSSKKVEGYTPKKNSHWDLYDTPTVNHVQALPNPNNKHEKSHNGYQKFTVRDEEASILDRFKDHLFPGKQVTFKKDRVVSWVANGIEGNRVEGYDTKDYPIVYKENILSEERLSHINEAKYLAGYVSSIIFAKGKITCWLNSTAPAAVILTYNQVTLPRTVWSQIVTDHNCSRCNGILLEKDYILSSLTFKDKEEKFVKKLLCPQCILTTYRKQDVETKQRIDKWAPIDIEKVAKELGY